MAAKTTPASSSISTAIAAATDLNTLRLNIHVLREHFLGNMNRGADGLVKRMLWGDTWRQRASSQCLKAALRDNVILRDSPLAKSLGMSVRSAKIADRGIGPIIQVEGGLPEAEATAYADALIAAFFRGDAKKAPPPPKKGPAKKAKRAVEEADEEVGEDADEPEEAASEDKRNTIMVLGVPEMQSLATVAIAAHKAGLTPKDVAAKKWGTDPALKDALAAVKAMAANHVGLDGALFGRFATGSTFGSVDAAVLVGSTMTIHPIQNHMDDFTAQDTLRLEHEPGAAHLNTAELSSGLSYTNIVIEVGTLMTNLGDSNPQTIADAVDLIVQAVLSTDPSAKRGNTGGAGPIFEAIVEVLHGPALTAAGFCRSEHFYDTNKAADALLRFIMERQDMLIETQVTEKIISLRQARMKAFLKGIRDVFLDPTPLTAQTHNLLAAE